MRLLQCCVFEGGNTTKIVVLEGAAQVEKVIQSEGQLLEAVL